MAWRLYPYNQFSEGGTGLIHALGGLRIKREGKYVPKKSHKIINWGNRELPPLFHVKSKLINQPASVALCIDKRQFFRTLNTPAPNPFLVPSTFDKATAQAWLDRGATVVARTVLNGHSGAGIVICTPKGTHPLPDAPLYTKYIPKDEEYRLHIIRTNVTGQIGSDVFYIQKKVKRKNFDGKHNRRIRCFSNGYTYQHDHVDLPAQVIGAAVMVFRQTDLDFGAVDVIFCKRDSKAYVLEINTAPGLEGTSVRMYADAFKKYF